MKNKKGQLIVICGPSGVGKGTIVAEVMAQDEKLTFSVSATTRAPRDGEEDGKHYYFMTREKFVSLAESGEMLEHAKYSGNFYGTPRSAVEEKLSEGFDVILEIDIQGAFQVKEKYPQALFIFILPPSLEVLEHRLKGRGTETPESIAKRMSAAIGELEKADRFDYLVVNGELEKAVDDVKAVITAGRCRRDMMSEQLNALKRRDLL